MDLGEIDMMDPEILQDPYPYFERLRNEAPVFRDPKTNIVYISTYDLIYQVNSKPHVFSNQFGMQLSSGLQKMDPEVIDILKDGWFPVNTMLTADPPEHTRYRKLVNKAFSRARVERLTEYIEGIVNELIDDFINEGHCDFKRQFGNELPMRVIADLLGVPRENMDTFRKWSNAFVDQLGGIASKEEQVEAAKGVIEFQKYFAGKADEKRANPVDDVISDLATGTLEEDGDPRSLNVSEILSILQQLLVAGNETTAHSLTAGLYYLLSNPAEMKKVLDDPGLVPNFVEETLRFLTPSNNMWRVAKEDITFEGVPIKTDDLILLRYGSANRDESRFSNAADFDVSRENAKEHMAFGGGIHTCLGAQLARKEMNIAFPIILKRLANLRFAEGKNTFRYAPNILLRGVLELHLEFDKAQ